MLLFNPHIEVSFNIVYEFFVYFIFYRMLLIVATRILPLGIFWFTVRVVVGQKMPKSNIVTNNITLQNKIN